MKLSDDDDNDMPQWTPCDYAVRLSMSAMDSCEDCRVLNGYTADGWPVNMPAPVKEVFYLAHPVSGDVKANIANAIAWIKWLTLNDPSRVYVAPWVAEVQAFDFDSQAEIDSSFYDRVLADDQTVVSKLDGILLVGGRISRGMQLELDQAKLTGQTVQDWSYARTPDELHPDHLEAIGCQ